jgi:hypothetical protein
MKTRTNGMKVIFLLAMAVVAWEGNSAPAMAVDISLGSLSGERGPSCDFFYDISAPILLGGKALSADSYQYTFSFRMMYGKTDKECGNEKPMVVNANVEASWDGKTGQARESISINSVPSGKKEGAKPPPSSVTSASIQTLSNCPKNPWTSSDFVECVPVSIDYGGFQYHFADSMKFPVTALYLGRSGREQVAAKITWGTGDFAVPPQNPPQVSVNGGYDVANTLFLRGSNVNVMIKRPSDGSPQWYLNKTVSYDVQIQVKRAGGGGTKAFLDWANKPWSGDVRGDTANFILPHSWFFNDPESDWYIEHVTVGTHGDFRSARIRARVHDDAIVRPWSEWVTFVVQVPIPTKKAPSMGGPVPHTGGIEPSGRSPAPAQPSRNLN